MRKKWKENCTMKTYFSRNEPFYFSCHATWFKSPGLGAFITQYNVLFWVETALRAVDVMDRSGRFYFYIMHDHVQWIWPVFTWFYWFFSFLDPSRTRLIQKLVSKPSFHPPRNPIHTLIKRFLELKTNLLGLWNHAGARRVYGMSRSTRVGKVGEKCWLVERVHHASSHQKIDANYGEYAIWG